MKIIMAFVKKTGQAKEKNKGFQFLRYRKNLICDSEGIYSYGAKISNLDLGRRTSQNLDYWSPTSSKHLNYTGRMLKVCYDLYEHPHSDANVQNLSYWDHT